MIRACLVLAGLLPAIATGQEPPKDPIPLPVPVVEPSQALSGRALLEALRGGGYVMLMRHSKQGRFTQACKPEEPNLTAEGQAQARKVGSALRELGIPLGSVRASKLCRAIETAQLLEAGAVSSTPDLNPGTRADKEIHAARQKLLAETPKAGTNTILVSHAHNSAREEERVLYELGEVIVFRPDGRGGAVAVARVRAEEWAELAK